MTTTALDTADVAEALVKAKAAAISAEKALLTYRKAALAALAAAEATYAAAEATKAAWIDLDSAVHQAVTASQNVVNATLWGPR